MSVPLQASVILPTHGRRASLLHVLEGLSRQTVLLEAFEVIVICDGDVDRSAHACRSFVAASSLQLRVIEQTNAGPAVARNRGIEAARAPLLIFIDDDVVPDERLIEAHLRAHANEADGVFVGPLLPPPGVTLNLWGRWEEHRLCRLYDEMATDLWQPTYRQFHTGNASILKRHVVEAGAFDPAFRRAEDVELALRLEERGLRFVFLPEARGWHHVARNYTTWLRLPVQYGAADAEMARTGPPQIAWFVATEYRRRHPWVRVLVELCMDRPLLYRTALAVLGAYLRCGNTHLRLPYAMAVCGVIYNLRYYQSFGQTWGPRSVALNLLRGHGAVSLNWQHGGS